jgi:hypothetical protein
MANGLKKDNSTAFLFQAVDPQQYIQGAISAVSVYTRLCPLIL